MKPKSSLLREHKTSAIVHPLLISFQRHLRAERKDPDTVAHYVGATQQFLDFAAAEGLPDVVIISREHVEMWLERLHETYSPYTVRNRHQGLRMFFSWLAEEGEIDRNPMARIRPPSVEQAPKDIVSTEDMTRVFAYLDRRKLWRDAAMLAILYDTGMRASELAECRSDHVNMDSGVILIPTTKANRIRTVHLGPTGMRYLDRYHRKPRSNPDYLLNGPRGKMTRSGIYWAVRNLFEEVGVSGTIGAHDLRHTSASHVAAAGEISESEAMALYGWRDPDMWRHYTAQAREKAALDAHRRSSPLERLRRA